VVAFFKSVFESDFQFAGFQVLFFFVQQVFFLSAKFRVGFIESLKLASKFFGLRFGQLWF